MREASMKPAMIAGVLGLVILAALAVWVMGRKRGAEDGANASKPAGEKFISVVLLLKRPVDVSREQFLTACERAFGQRPGAEDMIKTPSPAKYAVRRGGSAVALLIVNVPYVKDRGAVAECLRTFELKEVMQEHTAWLAVDFVRNLPAGGKAQAYRWVATIAANLMGPECIGIYNVETQELNVVRPDTAELLCSSTPLKAFAYQAKDEIIDVKSDDAEMLAAMNEAKRRWPEFVAAFRKKRPMQGFAVKAPFATPRGGWEHMWVEVDRIDGETIAGRVSNDPGDVPNVKCGDSVTVKIADVEDWIYQDGTRMAGGFTAEVLKRR
jgi:uncharacterized protein YegJ (DUF2314 family)